MFGHGRGGLFNRRPMRDIATERGGELRFIIRENLRVVPAAGERHVGQSLIHERFACEVAIDVHDHAVGCLSLAAVRCDRIAEVEMRIVVPARKFIASEIGGKPTQYGRGSGAFGCVGRF
jgi:hypothetical protein